MTECIYHSDKIRFDSVRKDLRKAKIIPRYYSPRLAMAVCSCRKRGTSLDSRLQENIASEISSIYEDLKLPKWLAFPDTATFVENLLNRSNLSVSQTKFALIFYNALNKDYDALKEEMKKGGEKEMKEEKKHWMNKTGFAKMIRRKKSSCPVKGEVTLPIFGGNSNLLEQKTGKGFCNIGKQFDCVIMFESDKTREFMNNKGIKTVVTIWCKSRESFNQIHRHLETLADSIQKPITLSHEREQQRWAAYAEYRRSLSIYEKQSPACPSNKLLNHETDRKEIMSDDYAFKKNQNRKHKTHLSGNKEESSPLRGGHCLNCLESFESLKTSSNEECKFHAGFLRFSGLYNGRVHKSWSCCGLEIDTTLKTPSNQLHSENGCIQGRHVWRPHQKASRGEKSEKKYWQNVLKQK